MAGKNTALLLILSMLIILIALTTSCSQKLAKTEEKRVEKIEIKEYQGEKLGSSNDFRENSIKGPQHVDIKNYRLEIGGLVTKPHQYTYDEVIKNHKPYKKVTTLHCVEGWSVKILWEGILVKDLLNDVEPDPKANTVIFYAYDGYSTSMPLDYIINKNIMIAYNMNDAPERGFPFELVAEDKWGYKWIKWLTKIELSDNPNYRGYWEQRGYNQKGNVEGPIFEE